MYHCMYVCMYVCMYRVVCWLGRSGGPRIVSIKRRGAARPPPHVSALAIAVGRKRQRAPHNLTRHTACGVNRHDCAKALKLRVDRGLDRQLHAVHVHVRPGAAPCRYGPGGRQLA